MAFLRGWAPALVGLVSMAATAAAQTDDAPDDARTTALAIYPDDLAAITLTRRIDLSDGPARLAIDNLSPGAVPGSVDLRADGVTVRQQRLLPWPITRARLLQHAVGTEVTLVRTPETAEAPVTRTATLLAVEPDIVVNVDGRIEIDPPGRIALDSLPEGLPESPTAVFDIASTRAGTREVELRYLSRGLGWSARYVARWDRDAARLDLTGRARITNSTNRAVAGDRVTLVAGSVPTVTTERRRDKGDLRAMTAAASAAPEAGGRPTPEQRADLRLYPLPDAVRVPADGTVSRRLLGAEDIAVETRYRVTGLATNRPGGRGTGDAPEDRRTADLRLAIPDTEAAGLDKALPAGTVRVYDGEVFRGARPIADTPPGTRLTLDLGSAVDVTATAKVTGYDKLSRDSYEVGRRVTVKNAKAREVDVRVVGAFHGDWEMISESTAHTRNAGGDPVWTVAVPAGGETAMTYRVRVRH
jgi:hypothetical protein